MVPDGVRESTLTKSYNLASVNEFHSTLDGCGRRFAIVVSRFNSDVTNDLLAGATASLIGHGVEAEDIDVYWVPGAWELPQTAGRLVGAARHDAVITLGCVIRGGTPHFDYVAGEATRGLGAVARASAIPVVFGVLTTDTREQAAERADPHGVDKGGEVASSAVEMVGLFDDLR